MSLTPSLLCTAAFADMGVTPSTSRNTKHSLDVPVRTTGLLRAADVESGTHRRASLPLASSPRVARLSAQHHFCMRSRKQARSVGALKQSELISGRGAQRLAELASTTRRPLLATRALVATLLLGVLLAHSVAFGAALPGNLVDECAFVAKRQGGGRPPW